MVLCAIGLALVLIFPLWRIELDAPQYPEGLNLLIYPNKMGGNVEIVNGLNHYIGMKTLHADDFIEFTILPYIIGFFSLLALLTGISAKPKILTAFVVLFVSFGIIAMADFWRWEYNYGHDLNPEAAIVVPGMSYQPPLIGFKQLLNFGAYSIPDTGGWIFIGVGLLSVFCLWKQWKSSRIKKTNPAVTAAMLFVFMIPFISCSSGPEALNYGKDNCGFCKMTITDNRFGAEIITQKGRVYKYDDSYCLLAYLKTGDLPAAEIRNIYIANFAGNHELIDVNKALLLQSKELRGPMGGEIAAFDNTDSLTTVMKQFPGISTSWGTISK